MTKFKRIFKEAFTDFIRNGWLSITAVLITTLALLTVSVFLVLILSTNKVVHDLKDKVDIVVNFKDSASENLIQQLKAELLARPQIKNVRYISKADALEEFKTRESVRSDVRELVTATDNPLPRGLQIQSVDFAEFDHVSDVIKTPVYAPFIDSSTYDDNKALIENINSSTKFAERAGIVLSLFFILVSVLVVFNTVKLAVLFRTKEIEIMRLVGASESFVKYPFLIEGFLYGFFALIITTIIGYFGISLFTVVAKGTLFEKFVQKVIPIYYTDFWFITAILFVVGTLIGLGSSWLSIRKNVKV